jgi:hypothetical protein
MTADEANPPIFRDQDHIRQWVAFYARQGYTEPESEILATQLCGNDRRSNRATIDDRYGFQRTGKYHRRRGHIRKTVSLEDIRCAMADFARQARIFAAATEMTMKKPTLDITPFFDKHNRMPDPEQMAVRTFAVEGETVSFQGTLEEAASTVAQYARANAMEDASFLLMDCCPVSRRVFSVRRFDC